MRGTLCILQGKAAYRYNKYARIYNLISFSKYFWKVMKKKAKAYKT
jgi:hypothetical protein